MTRLCVKSLNKRLLFTQRLSRATDTQRAPYRFNNPSDKIMQVREREKIT